MASTLEYLRLHLPEMEAFLKALVEHESPSDNKEALDSFADMMADRLRSLGASVVILPQAIAGNHLRAEFDLRPPSEGKKEAGQILALCHMDTVWPLGELARRPFRIEGRRACGPGVWDMKACITVGYFAVKAIKELGLHTRLRVVFLFNSDEEVQSRSSRSIIEAEAKKSSYCLCLEPSIPPGTLQTFHKSVGTFTLEITGRASHAGAEHEKGISAIQELANQIIRLHSLTDYSKGITVNVGVVSGGTRPNIVADYAKALIDVRISTPEQGESITHALHGLQSTVAGTSIKVTGGIDRPPMVRSPQVVAFFQRAKAIANQLGFDVAEAGSGGVTDANLTASLGTPTLDGLGPIGDGAHATSEFTDLDSFPLRGALIAELLQTLG